MKYIIVSGSCDIGSAIIDDLIRKGHDIIYTYNSIKNDRFKKLLCFKLDISSKNNIQEFAKNKTNKIIIDCQSSKLIRLMNLIFNFKKKLKSKSKINFIDSKTKLKKSNLILRLITNFSA